MGMEYLLKHVTNIDGGGILLSCMLPMQISDIFIDMFYGGEILIHKILSILMW